MIVVVGSPIGLLADDHVVASGTASRVSLAAAAAGRTVQLVGKTGDDPTADGVVLALARGGVGHVALLRDPARATPLETPADSGGEPDDLADAEAAGSAVAATTAGPALEAADVDLGLRYLTDFAVIVLAEPGPADVVGIVAEAARWSGARLVLVVGAGEPVPADLPADAIVFEAPEDDRDGAFATLVGGFAAALDDGTEPGAAFRAAIASDGWTGAAVD